MTSLFDDPCFWVIDHTDDGSEDFVVGFVELCDSAALRFNDRLISMEIIDDFLWNAAGDTMLEADEGPIRFRFREHHPVGAANYSIATK